MKGASRQTRRRNLRKTPEGTSWPEVHVDALPDHAVVQRWSEEPLSSTPKRSRRIQQRGEVRLTSTPVKKTSTPVKKTSTPVRKTSTPVRKTSTPVRTSSTPVKTSSSVRTSSTPVRTSSTLVRKTSTPVRTSSTPVKTSSSVRTSSTTVRTSSTPVRTSSSPVKTSSSPVRTSSTTTFSSFTDVLSGADQLSGLDAALSEPVSAHRRERTAASAPKKRQREGETRACRKKRGASEEPSEVKGEEQTDAVSAAPVRRSRRKPGQKDEAQNTPASTDSPLSAPPEQEEKLPDFSFEEDEELDEEDEELQSFLDNDRKPTSIREGMFVWYKLRKYPFWPSLVKRVNHKQKKASILLIDSPKIYTKKGFAVALKALKPFDCDEANELESKAKEDYRDVLVWSLTLISDYRMRIACGSFSGSFIEYCAHDMSHPVMKTFPQGPAAATPGFAGDEAAETASFDEADSAGEEQEDAGRTPKRLLPDRSHAAHNRANEKLVNFIVKQRKVETRLLAVIHGQQRSSWLQLFQSARGKRVVNTYLEDERQLDQVYQYLKELYTHAIATAPDLKELKFIDLVPFVLDVLLPEAIISAIAGVDNISLQKAEEKFLRGRSVSARESQQFEVMIERYMRSK